MNKARVAFKHSGIAPSRDDAHRLVRYGVEFLEEAVPRFFGIEFRRISLAQSIQSQEVRGLLEAAEIAAAEERYNDAMVETSDAVGLVERALANVLPLPMGSIRVGGSDGRTADDLLKYLSGLRSVAVAAMMHFDLREHSKFRMKAPRVTRSISGSRQAVFNGQAQFTAGDATAAIEFATTFALAVQSRMS